jgi:hypothetical protein
MSDDAWTLKPGDWVPGGMVPEGDNWVEEAAKILEAAPIGTVARDREGDIWQRRPNREQLAWRLGDGPPQPVCSSRWLLSLYHPITIIAVPEGNPHE